MKVLNTVLTIIGYGFDAASLTSGPLSDLVQLLGRQGQESLRPSGQGDAYTRQAGREDRRVSG
jgi:hypothetical protein